MNIAREKSRLVNGYYVFENNIRFHHTVDGTPLWTGYDVTVGERVRIGKGVVLGNRVTVSYDTVIGEGVKIRDETKIGGHCSIAAYADILSGCSIGNHVDIGAAAIGPECVIGSHCVIGNSRLKQQTTLAACVKLYGGTYSGHHAKTPMYLHPEGGVYGIYVSNPEARLIGIGCQVHSAEWWLDGGANRVRTEYGLEHTKDIYDPAIKWVAEQMGWLTESKS